MWWKLYNWSNFVSFFIDIYVGVLSNQNQVSAKDYYLGFVSTTMETENPEAELKAGLDLLAPIEQKFVSVKDVYHPVDDGKDSQVFTYYIFFQNFLKEKRTWKIKIWKFHF